MIWPSSFAILYYCGEGVLFNWKIPAYAAGAAFLLSAFIGLLSTVGFGALLLRAILWALIFGGLGFGVDQAVRRFLPELLPNNPAPEDSEDEKEVDITIGEENPHEQGDSIAEVVGEAAELPGVGEDTASESGESAISGDQEEVEGHEEVEELSPVSSDADGNESAANEPGGLPSFDGVESAFEDTGVESEASSRESVDILGVEEDPKIVAEAVRTLMKKDEEG